SSTNSPSGCRNLPPALSMHSPKEISLPAFPPPGCGRTTAICAICLLLQPLKRSATKTAMRSPKRSRRCCDMPMNAQGRPSAPGVAESNTLPTISGDRGLDHEEKLIFELGREGVTGVDIPEVQLSEERLGGLRRRARIGLPGLSEPEVIRHYVRLSRM